MAGQKRSIVEVGDRSELGHKRVKMRNLESLFLSEGIDTNYPKYWKNKEATASIGSYYAEKDTTSQITHETVTLNSNVIQLGRMGKDTSQVVPGPALISFDFNAEVNKMASESDINIGKSNSFDLDLNAEDVSSSVNHYPFNPNKHNEQLKSIDASECGSTCGPLEEKDPMQVWKEMKQNGFMSSSHGGIPVPKPRGRKSRGDGIKKKMEVAKKEQADRFAMIAAPSGLLSGLNPGIINHVRNSKQVHSIIKVLMRSERHENLQDGNKSEKTETGTGRLELSDGDHLVNTNWSGMKRFNLCHEDSFLNTSSVSRQTIDFPLSSVHLRGDNLDKSDFLSHSNLKNEEDIVALKMSSTATMASENMSSLTNDESVNLTSVSSLSAQAANVASQWLELLHQDIKGRLAALRRSKKRVEAVIQTDLPLLISREFSSNQENDPYVAKFSIAGYSENAVAHVHKSRWHAVFDQVDKTLSEEEKQLENWLNQVKEMQLNCDRGLSQCIVAHGARQMGTSENDGRKERGDDSERNLGVRASAAAFYSTCNFLQSMENLPRF